MSSRLVATLVGFVMIIPVVLATACSATVTPPRSITAANPAIFFIPHQDDDVLTFGADMKNHVLAGREVVAVLLSDGSSSGLCKSRYTDANGIYDSTDRAECTAERDLEFTNAMNQLGVEPVIRANRQQDGSVTQAYASSVMSEYLALYPAASFKAQTYKESTVTGGHPDHDVVGEALKALTGTTDKRYYIKPALWDNLPTVGTFVTRQNINVALHKYDGFGFLSVPSEFDEQLANSSGSGHFNAGGADSKYHLPGA